MEEYSRRVSSGLVISRKAPNLVPRDSTDHTKERNGQVCSRAGCSSKVSSMKAGQIGSHNKTKTLRTPFGSSAHGKEIIGSSSRTPAAVNSFRKSFSDSKRKQGSQVGTYSDSSSRHEESVDISESSFTSGKSNVIVHSQPNSHIQSDAGSSSSGPSNRLVKRNSERFVGSSTSSILKPSNQGARNNGASTSRLNLKSLRCNSSSDVVPSGCSSPVESNLGKKRDIGRKKISEPESSSSARGKKINGHMLDNRRIDNYSRGISISDSRQSRTSGSSGYDETANLRAQRFNGRTRLSHQENGNRLPLVESPLLTPSPSSPHRDISLETMTFSSDNQFSTQTPSHRASSFRRPGSSSDTWHNRSRAPYDVGISRSFMNRDALRQYNLDGIAEMLLALERIEQDEEPSYEQLLVLETNLFLGLGYHDQHREMRLDIDHMSYEELLALEERMGSVSTALSEEDLAKCLKRSIFQGIADLKEGSDDVKCSICQEEYADGHEVGRLKCDHRYHVECIEQWLRIKNWCPICKASAASSPSPSLSVSLP